MTKYPGSDTNPNDIGHWKPARKFPEHYPGECPDQDYLLLNDQAQRLRHERNGDFSVPEREVGSLNQLLSTLGLPRMEERIAVLAYGANRNPATLHIKLKNYGYRPPNGVDLCIPVMRATLVDADVAACGIHGHGYLYGELLLNSDHCRGTKLDARVCMVDSDQLRVLNDSEGVRDGQYQLARIPGVRITAMDEPITALGYVAAARTWLSPVFDTPLGFSTVPASGRRYPSMTATQTLDHVLSALKLRGEVSSLSGLADDGQLASNLAKYLNGQWWYAFNTGQQPIPGYDQILKLLRSRMNENVLTLRTLDYLAELGNLVTTKAAYSPDQFLIWTKHRE